MKLYILSVLMIIQVFRGMHTSDEESDVNVATVHWSYCSLVDFGPHTSTTSGICAMSLILSYISETSLVQLIHLCHATELSYFSESSLPCGGWSLEHSFTSFSFPIFYLVRAACF